MKVEVDVSRCQGHGACVEACPEVFELERSDKVTLLTSTPDEALRPAVEDAALICPTSAITYN